MPVRPFPFRRVGKNASSLEELVELCMLHDEEAEDYLYLDARPIQKWLLELATDCEQAAPPQAQKYRDLVRETRRIVGQHSNNRETGLEEFIEAAERVLAPQSSARLTSQGSVALATDTREDELNRQVRAADWASVVQLSDQLLATDSRNPTAVKWKPLAQTKLRIDELLQNADKAFSVRNYLQADDLFQQVLQLE